MKIKWVVSACVVLLVCLLFILGSGVRDSAVAATNTAEKIESSLLDQVSTQGSADYIIRFTDQADLTPAYAMDWEARGEFVYNTLKQTAELSQTNAKAILDVQGIPYQTFIAGNDLFVYGSHQAGGGSQQSSSELATLNTLASLPEVSSIRVPQTYSIEPTGIINPFDSIKWAGDFLAQNVLTTVTNSTTATTDWGITDTKANQFWTTFSAKGAGIIVANIDTGVQWNHPALINQYACRNDPSNPKCWFDPTKVCPVGGPCDIHDGHGTHTMGTMVAKDDPSLPYIAGMSPDATWIACKACDSTSCSDVNLNACADWILAPGGNPANRPQVVNNSWGGPGGNNWYQAKVQAWRAAGIFPAFSAGNNSSCNSLASPGDYQESFDSASYASGRVISAFSSKGPSVFGSTPYTKPNISAPGSNIISTLPVNSWVAMSGTSMASPHSAGAVALLWSCNPALNGQVDATFRVLQNNADTPGAAGSCGAPPSAQGNYTYGYGYLDVLAAGKVTCNMLDKYSINQVIGPNEKKSVSLTIYNHGLSSLNWSIQESGLTGANSQQSISASVSMGSASMASLSIGADTSQVANSTASWITETPQSGTILPGQHADVTVSFDTTNVLPGIYRTSLLINSNDPFPPLLRVPVSLIVGKPYYFPIIPNR